MNNLERAFFNGFIKAAAPTNTVSTGQVVQQTPKPTMPANPINKPAPIKPLGPNSGGDIYSMLKHDEGFRPNTYVDTLGHKTIGYGSTNPDLVNGGHITEPAAASALTNHVQGVIANLQKRLGTNTFNTLPKPAQMSLENLGYQTGDIGKWPHLVKSVQSNDFSNAANDIRDSKVNIQTPQRNSERIKLMEQAAKGY